MSTRALQIDLLLTPVIDYRDGSIASGYTVYFYAAGTSTAKNDWTEKEKTNPYTSRTLSSAGTVQVYGDGVYKIVIKDTDGTTVYEWDNVKIQYPNIAVLSKSGTYTATIDDDYILVGATMTLNLYAAASFTHPICVKLTGSHTLTIDPNGAELIEGASTYTLSTANSAVWLFSNGSTWYVANATSIASVDSINLVASIGGSKKLTAKSTTIDIEDNNEYLRQKNAADDDYISLIKVNGSDQIELGAVLKAVEILNTGLKIQDTGGDHTLTLKCNEDLTGNKTLSLVLNDTNRTIDLSGDVTIGGAYTTGGAFTSENAISNLNQKMLDVIMQRAVFTYNGGATAYTVKVSAAFYMCKDKVCYWDSELTTGAIGTPAASDWYYLYLDYSEITSGTAIVAGKLIWSNTEPSWDATYKGWYNGDDRCIFAALTNSGPTNILEFFHDGGDYVVYADAQQERTLSDLDDTFTDLDCASSVPKFSTKANVQFYGSAAADNTFVITYWRTNGQTGSTGHQIFAMDADLGAVYPFSTVDVITDSSQIIEIKNSAAGDHQVGAYCNGWFLPIGI